MSYHKERDRKILEKLDNLVATLPQPFCSRFFLGISQRTAPLTRLGYASDLRQFFDYFEKIESPIKTKEDLDALGVHDIELYVASLHQCGAASKQRKLCTLRSFFAYLFKVELISKNIMPNIDLPKVKEKPIIRMKNDEVEKMLDVVPSMRDEMILVLFLSTGIRVSELVGLDVSDVDLSNSSFKVTRKGGVETILYLPEECAGQLAVYMSDLDEGPLFRTSTGNRLGVRAIQLIVKRYASAATPLKNISPHKLRSTFGTNLYRATGDIYIVADVLGHKDVNTTKKHYAAINEDQRKEVAKHVKIY